MPPVSNFSESPAPPERAASFAECPEFVAAVAYLSTPDRVLIARICRRLEQVEAAHGTEVAEAAIERVIRVLLSEDGRYLS